MMMVDGKNMMSLFGTITYACIWSISGQYADYDGCSFELVDSHNITSRYNLSWFSLEDSSFKVDDDEIEDWKYQFNICGPLSSLTWDDPEYIPDYCKNDDSRRSYPCLDWNNNGTCTEYYNVTEDGKTGMCNGVLAMF